MPRQVKGKRDSASNCTPPLMPETNSRYPLAELTTIKTTKHMSLYNNEELLLLTEVIENLKRVQRQRLHTEHQEKKAAAKARSKTRRKK